MLNLILMEGGLVRFLIEAAIKSSFIILLVWMASRFMGQASAAFRSRLWGLTLISLLILLPLILWAPDWNLALVPPQTITIECLSPLISEYS